MKETVEILKQQEEIMAKEKGPFDLFALFLREDAPGKWDLVVAAVWIEKDKETALKYIASTLQKTLSKEQLLKLSRIAIIDESNPALEVFQRAMHVEHGVAEIQDSNFFGLQIKHMYLITSRRRTNSAPNNAIDTAR
ncbi:MAG: hypothetical protein NTW12_11720 [Deltaproteobacteria bacterium]|nr:hypothetical protein [Deltaproteobacteria bacterium]